MLSKMMVLNIHLGYTPSVYNFQRSYLPREFLPLTSLPNAFLIRPSRLGMDEHFASCEAEFIATMNLVQDRREISV